MSLLEALHILMTALTDDNHARDLSMAIASASGEERTLLRPSHPIHDDRTGLLRAAEGVSPVRWRRTAESRRMKAFHPDVRLKLYGHGAQVLADTWAEKTGIPIGLIIDTAEDVHKVMEQDGINPKRGIATLAEAMQYHAAGGVIGKLQEIADEINNADGKLYTKEYQTRSNRTFVERLLRVNAAQKVPEEIPADIKRYYPDPVKVKSVGD